MVLIATNDPARVSEEKSHHSSSGPLRKFCADFRGGLLLVLFLQEEC